MHSGATSTRLRAVRNLLCAPAFLVALSSLGSAQVDVLTANYDNNRTNANLQETQLTPATIGPLTFGKLGSLPVDGQVYAQPLYVNSVSIPGHGAHNVVYIATQHNSVYAYDADSVTTPVLYWHVNLGPSVPSDVVQPGYKDVTPEVGILSTGVIDASAGVLYVVDETLQAGAPIFQLHGLDLTTGAERMNGPVTISAKYAGNGYGSDGVNVIFDPTMHIQRPGLLLSNGSVYIAFGSHADDGGWHGWVVSYSAANLGTQTGVFNATPNGIGGSIWQSGRGLAADEIGNLYVITGNGDSGADGNISESMVKLNGGNLQLLDWYQPGNEESLSNNDYDLSAGVALIPGTHTAVAGDKFGNLYVVNGDSMGHMDGSNSAQFSIGNAGFGLYTLAVWNRFDGAYVYAQQQWNAIESFRIAGGALSTTPASASNTAAVTGYSGFTISANGGQPTSGVLWQLTTDVQGSSHPGTLHAFNASDLSIELWNSDMKAADQLGTFAKFVSPTVANGKVYVPTFSGAVVVYGLTGSSPDGGGKGSAAIAAVSDAASYAADAVSPGELVALFGLNLGPATAASLQLDSGGMVANNLGATRVLFDGIPAAMIYAGNNQVSAVAPYELTNPTTQVQVEYQGVASSPFAMTVVPAHPAIFTADSSGGGQAAALNQDGTVNSSANPAAPGSVLVFYATGMGQTSPGGVDGSVTGYDNLPQPLLPVTVTIGGQPAQVYYAGAAPGMVAGVAQINVMIPATVASSDAVPVTLTVGKQVSPQNVTVAVQ
jgi:uncharacterized protein (TIGR03437 family)